MSGVRVMGIGSAVVLLATGSAHVAHAQAPDPPAAWLFDQSDRLINVSACALACFDLVYAHSTPAYYSFDTPRNVTLVYNSRTAYPRPFVIVDAQAASTGVLPEKLSISLKVNGVPVQPLDGSAPIYYWYNDASRPVARLEFQFDGGTLSTGRYPVQAEVRAWSSGVASAPVYVNAYVLVVNELNSPFGVGWNIAGLQRLHINGNDAVITEGDGSAVHFQRSCADPSCAWITPDGDFSTLASFDDHYERIYPDRSTVHFNLDGTIGAHTDRHSNYTYFGWSAGLLTTIQDPAGKQITLGYSPAGTLDQRSGWPSYAAIP